MAKLKKKVKHDSAHLAVLQEHNNLIVKDACVKGDQDFQSSRKISHVTFYKLRQLVLVTARNPVVSFSYTWAKRLCVCPHVPCVSPLLEKLV